MTVESKHPKTLTIPVTTKAAQKAATALEMNSKSASYCLPDVKTSCPSPTKAELSESTAASEGDFDPWAMPELADTGEAWADLTTSKKFGRVGVIFAKLIALMMLLYVFFCSLDFLSSAFRLLGSKTAGEFFRNSEHLKNPVVGLMLGILATVLMQSSSTSTSIVVTMVASNFLDVHTSIPIIMGANIGTSVTNTLVSLAQSADRSEFRRAFAGATVHDMFNWLTVIVLLPLEVATGYLYHLTNAVVNSFHWKTNKNANKELLTVITKPFTDLVIQLDKKVINALAMGDNSAYNKSLIKEWCKYEASTDWVNNTLQKNVSTMVDGEIMTILQNVTEQQEIKSKTGTERCVFLLNGLGLGDSWVGLILLAISLVLLCTCLVLMVKVLHSMLRGQMASVIKRTLNSDFPGRLAFLTGYVAMFVGCGMTILVQSSSIFTSALTPLVGLGVISVERVYPLTLGSNLGTTTTGILASLAATGDELKHSIQIALCHMFFNLTGILLFYPIPFMRIPVSLAKKLGNITAKYRWFSVAYLVLLFFLLPGIVFSLSVAGSVVLMCFGIPIIVILAFAIVVNTMQHKCPSLLPSFLRTWDWLPSWLHSLKPWDRLIMSTQRWLLQVCGCCRCCNCCQEPQQDAQLSYMYKSGFHSQTAMLSGSLRTIPSQNGMSLHTVPSGDGIDNPAMLQSITSV